MSLVVETPRGATVIFRDLRYVDPDRPAMGTVLNRRQVRDLIALLKGKK